MEKRVFMPKMIKNKESNYIIVEGSESNKAHFEDYLKVNRAMASNKIPADTNIYYYEPEDYDMVIKEMAIIEDLKQAKERQEKIDNPRIRDKVIRLNTREELIEFLIEEYKVNESVNIVNYSDDIEMSRARLDAEIEYLKHIAEDIFE